MREPAPDGGRALATAILFLLPPGGRSLPHRVDATELWFWHAGAPLALQIGSEAVVLGSRVLDGEQPQAVVPAGVVQSAKAPDDGWALVSCVVTPGFEFSGFELTDPAPSPAS